MRSMPQQQRRRRDSSGGGGVAYIRCIPVVNKTADSLEGDEKTGARIIARALSSPLRQIAENAGQEGAIILQQVEKLPEMHGYNALTDEYIDMIKAGILDPTKVAAAHWKMPHRLRACLSQPKPLWRTFQKKSAAAAMPAGRHGILD